MEPISEKLYDGLFACLAQEGTVGSDSDVTTVPKLTTPEVPFDTPFIVIPVIVPSFFVYPSDVILCQVGIALSPLKSSVSGSSGIDPPLII